jgi:hypothetical protein
MTVVYHGVPRGMVGSVLYPLNQLHAIAPDRYAFQKAKYAGRKAVLRVAPQTQPLIHAVPAVC